MKEWVVWIFEGIALIAALLILLTKSIFQAALFLLIIVLAVGIIFGLYGSEFLFLSQIMIYGAGILVLILFASMVISRKEQTESIKPTSAPVLIAFSGIMFIVGQYVVWGQPKGLPYSVSTHSLGTKLLQDYPLPLEIAGVLLLVSMIGAIISSIQRPEQP